MQFQSRSGFLMRCDRKMLVEVKELMQFQSLLGFLMRCDNSNIEFDEMKVTFQSLLGFLMRCDLWVDGSATRHMAWFQSLLGFLMRCDMMHGIGLIISIASFNPYWVF